MKLFCHQVFFLVLLLTAWTKSSSAQTIDSIDLDKDIGLSVGIGEPVKHAQELLRRCRITWEDRELAVFQDGERRACLYFPFAGDPSLGPGATMVIVYSQHTGTIKAIAELHRLPRSTIGNVSQTWLRRTENWTYLDRVYILSADQFVMQIHDSQATHEAAEPRDAAPRRSQRRWSNRRRVRRINRRSSLHGEL